MGSGLPEFGPKTVTAMAAMVDRDGLRVRRRAHSRLGEVEVMLLVGLERGTSERDGIGDLRRG